MQQNKPTVRYRHPFPFRTILQLIALFILPLAGTAQCYKGNNTFGDGEQVRYTVTYNWGPVWVDAGLVTFSASEETYKGKKAWHLKGTGKTFASYDLLFKVRDYFDSWVDQSDFRTLGFRRYTYEGGYSLLNTLEPDYNASRIYSATKTNDNPQRYDTLPVRYCAFDMLSAIYYTRTLDFTDPKPGIKQGVLVLIDDAYYDIYIKVLGREEVELPDGRRFRCIKFAARMVQGTIFKGDEDVVVWVTDDGNKIPVYIEAKIIVGTVKAYLKDYKHLKNPVTSLVR